MTSPKWMNVLAKALSHNPKSTIYSFATVSTASGASVPRVRSVVHRSFLSPSADTPLLLCTTDIRSPKVTEVSTSVENLGEICWWIAGSSEQYRFNGPVHLLPHQSHPLAKLFPGERLAPSETDDGQPWDWEKERLRIFNEKMPSEIRASFSRPAPGSKLDSYEDAEKWANQLPKSYEVEEGDEKTKALIDEALKNFALVIFEPKTVEWLELGVTPNRRTKFNWDGKEWQEWIVVP